jgi:hypothetical protein
MWLCSTYWNPSEVIRKVAAVGEVSQRHLNVSIYKMQAFHLVSSGGPASGREQSEREVDHIGLSQSNANL